MGLENETTLHYFKLAMFDLQSGISKEKIRHAQQLYEELEEFEICEGIRRAIEFYEAYDYLNEIIDKE